MGTRIATCKCGLEFYDSTKKRTLCNRCTADKAEKAAKMQAVKSFYAGVKRRGKFRLNSAVIQCLEREGLTIPETAKVLGYDDETIRFEWEIAKQNAT
jgi:hypothetical protein